VGTLANSKERGRLAHEFHSKSRSGVIPPGFFVGTDTDLQAWTDLPSAMQVALRDE
jgi:hypothetical protein